MIRYRQSIENHWRKRKGATYASYCISLAGTCCCGRRSRGSYPTALGGLFRILDFPFQEIVARFAKNVKSNPEVAKKEWNGREVRGLDDWFYSDKELALAGKVLDSLRSEGLPIYRAERILDAAKALLKREPLAEKKACPEEQAD